MANDLVSEDQVTAQSSGCLEWAKALTITTPEDHAREFERLQGWMGLGKRIADWFKPQKDAAYKAHRIICEKEQEALKPHAEGVKLAKDKLLAFEREEKAKAERERQRKQAEIDAKIRAERLRLEQAAEDQRRIEAEARAKAAEAMRQAEQERLVLEAKLASVQMAEAEKRRLEKEAEESRVRLLQQAALANQKADAASAVAESKVEEVVQIVSPVISVPTSFTKAKGGSTRTTWVATINDVDKFMRWAANADRFDLLLPNEKALQAYAKAMSSMARMEGVTFSEKESLAVKAK